MGVCLTKNNKKQESTSSQGDITESDIDSITIPEFNLNQQPQFQSTTQINLTQYGFIQDNDGQQDLFTVKIRQSKSVPTFRKDLYSFQIILKQKQRKRKAHRNCSQKGNKQQLKGILKESIISDRNLCYSRQEKRVRFDESSMRELKYMKLQSYGYKLSRSKQLN